jgi:hypothetical protein
MGLDGVKIRLFAVQIRAKTQILVSPEKKKASGVATKKCLGNVTPEEFLASGVSG